MEQGEQRGGHDVTSPEQQDATSPPVSPIEEEQSNTTPKMAHDSMVTVRLSEPPSLTLNTSLAKAEAIDAPETAIQADDRQTMLPASSDQDTSHSRDSIVTIPSGGADESPQTELEETQNQDGYTSDDQEEVDWEQLEKKEDEQAKDDDTDDNVQSSSPPLRRLIATH
jgi:hypothetical protein